MTGLLEMVDFALGGDIEDLHGTLHALRGIGPVAPVRYADEPAWIFTTYEAVRNAYRDDELFPAAAAFKETTEPVLGKTLQCMEGEEHRRNRALVSPAFRASLMPEQVQPILTELAHELVDQFAARGEADIINEFNRHFPGTVITRLLGVPREADVDFQRWAHELLSYHRDPEAGLAAREAVTSYLQPYLDERRREPRPDLLSDLATTEVDGEMLTDEEIFSFVRLVFAAGTDTTFFGIGNALYALLTHPEELERVRADLDGELRWAVEETLRWESPVSMEPRRSPHATTWYGQDLQPGSRVLFAIAAANRDPDVFEHPDRFDVGRRPEAIMTFGIGAHFCLGAHLARAELVTALRVLLERLDRLALVDPEHTRIAGTVLRGPNQLRVRFRAA